VAQHMEAEGLDFLQFTFRCARLHNDIYCRCRVAITPCE